MAKNKATLIFALVAMVLLTVHFPAFGGDPARVGTAGGTQVQVPVGARSLSMAGANLATVSGMEAIYWNPAGLSAGDYNAATQVSTMQIFNDINVNYLALASRVGSIGNLGFSLKAINAGDIIVTTEQDADGLSGNTYNPVLITGGLTFSKRLTDVIQFGITGKLIHESIPRASASAFAFDIGIQYHSLGGIEALSMGLAVKNIGSDMTFAGSGLSRRATDVGALNQEFRDIQIQSDKLPASVELALGYTHNINEENSILFSGNFLNNNFGNDDYRFGAEYSYSDLISLRGGYVLADGVESAANLYTFTLGVGLHHKFGGTAFSLDYAFRDSQYFDGNNLFSLTIGF